MISWMRRCGLSVSYRWRDSVVLHMYGLNISLKIGVLNPLFVLFLLIYLLQFIQVPLVTLGRLTGHNIKNSPPIFGFVLLFAMLVYLMKFPLWSIMCLIHIFGVPICVVHVGVFLDMGVEIHGGHWGHTLEWRGQCFFNDHSYSLV